MCVNYISGSRGVSLVSDVIEFLERFGQDADLRYATTERLEDALRAGGIDPALRAAILGKDVRALEALLGAEPNVCCAVHREEDEEDEEEEGGEGEKENEANNVRSAADLNIE
jgi:DNA-binding transcriptional LysR family regulator